MAEQVMGVAEARAQIPAILRGFREDPHARPVAIGAHRRPVAYLVPAEAELRAQARPLLPELRRLARVIRRLAAANRIENVEVFGSVATGTDRGDSDIDLLVTPQSEATYFDLARFAGDIETLMGRSVDVVSAHALRPGADDHIRSDAVAL